jgi:hypothetical protein
LNRVVKHKHVWCGSRLNVMPQKVLANAALLIASSWSCVAMQRTKDRDFIHRNNCRKATPEFIDKVVYIV